MSQDIEKAALLKRLGKEAFAVTQDGATEPAFTGTYWNHKGDGTYRCVCCDAELFDSGTKFDSGSGWPSYWKPTDDKRVRLLDDRSHGMVRTEVRCAQCDAHLGHLFDDGPNPTGQRYCINSCALRFEEVSGEPKT